MLVRILVYAIALSLFVTLGWLAHHLLAPGPDPTRLEHLSGAAFCALVALEGERATHSEELDVEFDEYLAVRGQQLVRLGLVLSGNQHRAEDLTQSALMNAYRHWRRVRRMDDPHAYVRRVLINAYISTTRRGSARETPMATPDFGQTAPDPALALVEHDAMWRMLAQLPPRERTVLVLRYYEDLDYAAIAAVLGITESTARATASRALGSLRAVQDPAGAKGHSND